LIGESQTVPVKKTEEKVNNLEVPSVIAKEQPSPKISQENVSSTTIAPSHLEKDLPDKKMEAAAFYREPITVEPATNFRQFKQSSSSKTTANQNEAEAKTVEINSIPEVTKNNEELLPDNVSQPGDIWQERWKQIKQNTTPGVMATGMKTNNAISSTPVTVPQGAELNIESAELEKPSSNKMLIRILVIVILVAIIAIGAVLILRKIMYQIQMLKTLLKLIPKQNQQ